MKAMKSTPKTETNAAPRARFPWLWAALAWLAGLIVLAAGVLFLPRLLATLCSSIPPNLAAFPLVLALMVPVVLAATWLLPRRPWVAALPSVLLGNAALAALGLVFLRKAQVPLWALLGPSVLGLAVSGLLLWLLPATASVRRRVVVTVASLVLAVGLIAGGQLGTKALTQRGVEKLATAIKSLVCDQVLAAGATLKWGAPQLRSPLGSPSLNLLGYASNPVASVNLYGVPLEQVLRLPGLGDLDLKPPLVAEPSLTITLRGLPAVAEVTPQDLVKHKYLRPEFAAALKQSGARYTGEFRGLKISYAYLNVAGRAPFALIACEGKYVAAGK
jgi:hypothetical protein